MNEEIVEVVAEILGLEREKIVPELRRNDEPRWDSLAHLRLITALEDRFDLKFTMEQIESFHSVEDILEGLTCVESEC